MQARTIQAFLRVLYTVNNNPQYILAKSSLQVPATVCTATTTQSAATTDDPTFARAPLKACLAVVCDSSPELLQDPARDFSLYVLDPLEAQPLPTSLSQTPDKTSSLRGVAVALGLMSWALESNDSTNVLVTGTILSNASPALEVVFALRETKRVPRPTLHSYSLLGSTSTPDSSQPPHPLGTGCWSSTSHPQPHPQERQTLTRSADFPELYIGPPRRAPGRPEGSTSSKSKLKVQTKPSSLSGMTLSNGAEIQLDSKQNVERRPKERTKPRPPRAPPIHSPFICAPLTRDAATTGPEAGTTAFYPQVHSLSQNQTQSHAHLYPQTQPHSQSTQNLLLGLLSAIPSGSSGNAATNTTPEQQAALVSALQGLLAANPHLLQLAATNTDPAASNEQQNVENKASDGDDDADSDIVILDSSAIDTAAFRKPSHRQLVTRDYNTNQESPMAGTQSTDMSPMPASTPPSGQEGTPTSSQTLTPTATPEAETPKSKYVSSGRADRGNVASSPALDVPATPTPSRTRKRKLEEYVQGEDQSFASSSPPSPSPSMSRTTTSRRVLTAKQRVPSSPNFGRKSASSPSVRLPSMLDSMRSMANSGSRLQISTSGSSMQGSLAFLATSKSGDPTMPVSDPPEFKVDHPDSVIPPANAAPGTSSLKRRLNMSLNEFMEEHEARKTAKIRKRPSLRHKSDAEVSTNVPQAGPSCPVKLASSVRHTRSSPPRSLFRSDPVAFSPPGSTGSVPGGVTSCAAPPATTLTNTAPSTSTLTTTQTKNPLKKFVVPAWARTSTATLPRLSEDVLARHQAEQEAKKAQLSLRRREAAKAKRKRLRTAERPSKESSDEDDDTAENDPTPRTSHSSSIVARSAPLPPPPPPSLPVFASDAVEPIPSSPPQSCRQPTLPVAPSTPPRKPVSPGSAPYRTPSKSGSCSLFTPSGQEPASLFTPSTPSVTPCHTRVTFTPRSPTVLHRSGAKKSPRKNVPQTLWTPKHNGASHQTPRNLRSGRNAPFLSPSVAVRTPRSQTGIGTRAFLLPPPSPCTLRTSHLQSQIRSDTPEGLAPLVSGVAKQEIDDRKDEPNCEMEEALLDENELIPPVQNSPTEYDEQRHELREINSNSDMPPAGEEYASSPLPPSSPLPASPFSSPVKHHGSDVDTPPINDLVVPDSDILFPSVGDSDAPLGPADTAWLSDDACPTAWFTDSEASAWLTETEAWLTDTEGGGPFLTDSDGAWLSDSEAVFGDMSSLPPSSASNWFSDDADVDTDGEVGAMEMAGQDVRFDTAAFERAFAALVERGGGSTGSKNGIGDVGVGINGATNVHGTGTVESEIWGWMQPVLGRNAVTGDEDDTGEEVKVVQDSRGLLDGLMET